MGVRRFAFALMSAATAHLVVGALSAHYTRSYPQHTRAIDRHSRALMSGSCSRCSRLFLSPLSRPCRCGLHTHVAGCGTGSRQDSVPWPHAHLSVRASGAGIRGPSLRTAWAMASGGEGGGARPRAADEQLVGGGQGVCLLPSRKEGLRGVMDEARAASPARKRSRCMHRERARVCGHDCRLGGQKRTQNIQPMSVTREVFQLNGWLKAHAFCGGSQAPSTRCGPGRAGRERREEARATAVHAACRGRARATPDWGRGARGEAHSKHVVHVRDAGGIPAQRLVEGRRGLPRVASRAHGAGRAAGRAGGGAGDRDGARSLQRGQSA